LSSPTCFSTKTFQYFAAARRNKKNKLWFERHRDEYEEYVKRPFEELTRLLDLNFSSELPGIDFRPRKVSRPTLRTPADDGSLVRLNSYAFFSEKQTSQFEWNPGIYVSLGDPSKENVLAIGLYMVSSRQMSRLRAGISENFSEIDSILSAKKLKSRWGQIGGEVYKRFPKGYDENSPPAKYLRHKQFFLSQDVAPKEFCQKRFFDRVIQDVDQGLPFLQWVRKTVGVYQRRS